MPLSGKLKLGLRAVVNKLQLKFYTRVKNAIKNTDVLMVATTEDQSNIKNISVRNWITDIWEMEAFE